MKRMSSNPADWGIPVITISAEQARKLLGIPKPKPKPTGPPPWVITHTGYISANPETSIHAWRAVEKETPIFMQACMQHNTRKNAENPW